ncbi:MAG: hypothetical protein N4J56_006587 [Chroococcidiopsis sp. SAG 2025]|nr:hypothetical protein [Chroococcidiopsis sp. SAG 2025]
MSQKLDFIFNGDEGTCYRARKFCRIVISSCARYCIAASYKTGDPIVGGVQRLSCGKLRSQATARVAARPRSCTRVHSFRAEGRQAITGVHRLGNRINRFWRWFRTMQLGTSRNRWSAGLKPIMQLSNVKQTGQGVRLIVCRLPVKTPWLNVLTKWLKLGF